MTILVSEKLFEDAGADDLVVCRGYDALKFGNQPQWSLNTAAVQR